MIVRKKDLDLLITYPLKTLGRLEELLFFDIETTGFSGDYSNLYLIGCAYYREGGWHLIQWFSDRADAEEEVLHAFFQFLGSFSCLIHFNGDGFDIPYLLKRCRFYDLPYDFSGIKSTDIYRLIRPLKKLLGLDSLKQKSVEAFLGISREDLFSGGQLIPVYEDYLLTREDRLYDLLILHNEEDLKGMPGILPILLYHDFLDGPFLLKNQETSDLTDAFGAVSPRVHLTYQSPVCLPVPVQAESSCYSLELIQNELHLYVELYTGELKRFYPDYQNYYYLICEDYAIHKSVGQYVEKDAKKKATAGTCYTRAAGTFLPQPAPLWEPCLKIDYKSKSIYALYEPNLFEDEKTAGHYLHLVLEKGFLLAFSFIKSPLI